MIYRQCLQRCSDDETERRIVTIAGTSVYLVSPHSDDDGNGDLSGTMVETLAAIRAAVLWNACITMIDHGYANSCKQE